MTDHHSTSRQTVIVIGGTGMLRAAVRTLVERGNTVVAAARRPGRGAPLGATTGEYVPVEGQWAEPEMLIDAIRTALIQRGTLDSGVHGAIIWIHTPHRQAVLNELERVLGSDATVLQLWGSATKDPREVMGEEDRADRPWRTRHLFLGYQRDLGGSRWLTSEEISSATVRAWDGEDDYFIAGRIDPWGHRP